MLRDGKLNMLRYKVGYFIHVECIMSKAVLVFFCCRPRDAGGGTSGRRTLGKAANGFSTRQRNGAEELLISRYSVLFYGIKANQLLFLINNGLSDCVM